MKSKQKEDNKLIEEKIKNINNKVDFILKDYIEREAELIKHIDEIKNNSNIKEKRLEKNIDDLRNDLKLYEKELAFISKVIMGLKFVFKFAIIVSSVFAFIYEFVIKPLYIDR